MTRLDGLPDKRLLKGKERRKAAPKDHFGKNIPIDEYQDMKVELYIPHCVRFNTIQISILGWIKLNPDITSNKLDFILYLIERKIKDKIRFWNNPFFRKESIVTFKTADFSKSNTKSTQYLDCDVVLFVMPGMIFDRLSIKAMMEPFVYNIIDDYLLTSDYFEVTRNANIDNRASKSAVKRYQTTNE